MEWKDVVDYEGIYEVSDTGEVRTKEGKTTHSTRHGVRRWKQRVLKQKISKDDCCRVTLYKNKKEKTWLVHRLVAEAFLPKIEGKNYINHIDGSRLNNNVLNLEWCDHKHNNNHAFDNDLIKTGRKIVLVNKETKEPHYFRSMSKAGHFLGKEHGFVSENLTKGKRELCGYWIFTEAGPN